MQSREYPELRFVEPAAWGQGRDGKAVRLSITHYTAGAERSTSAEDGAAYDARRTDETSTHFFHDSDTTVQCVYTWNRANAARHKGNRLGVQHELCGTAQTRAQWLDTQSLPTLRNGAFYQGRDCIKYGLEVRRLSVSEVRRAWYEFPNGPRGVCGHVDVTLAYPEDGGDHTDPGVAFPWDLYLDMIENSIKGLPITEGGAMYMLQLAGKDEVYLVWPGGKEHLSPDSFNALVAAKYPFVRAPNLTSFNQLVKPSETAVEVNVDASAVAEELKNDEAFKTALAMTNADEFYKRGAPA